MTLVAYGLNARRFQKVQVTRNVSMCLSMYQKMTAYG